jgi:2-haloalkanoic acid dehalogenase type II
MATEQATFSFRPKAILFDLMGTCVDWHSSILPTLLACANEHISGDTSAGNQDALMATIAMRWREKFFSEIHAAFLADPTRPPEDIDVTHRRTLDKLLIEYGLDRLTEEQRIQCVAAWHKQEAWGDVLEGLARLRRSGADVCVLANGSTRLQIDITKSAGLHFDMLFSSQLLGITKPDLRIYRTVVKDILWLEPGECLMVAAHAYDLRAAKKAGLKTAYIRRWTEDRDEDMKAIEEENDIFIEEEGLSRLANLLGL